MCVLCAVVALCCGLIVSRCVVWCGVVWCGVSSVICFRCGVHLLLMLVCSWLENFSASVAALATVDATLRSRSVTAALPDARGQAHRNPNTGKVLPPVIVIDCTG